MGSSTRLDNGADMFLEFGEAQVWSWSGDSKQIP